MNAVISVMETVITARTCNWRDNLILPEKPRNRKIRGIIASALTVKIRIESHASKSLMTTL